ncbi:hypothetical protein BDY21DRAFT_353647 [Lineolata rhizophorae]|uniref:Nephrocystin 3-like N-terminal domain-containing protein n=1 Tax=Lineolata rhizophorae TaxID=578093 RepID=A0A6A6NRF8_9PEZI|nr:hypothetical protein BDY21DRAFT_353647 [Lineolata rhizophorae]
MATEAVKPVPNLTMKGLTSNGLNGFASPPETPRSGIPYKANHSARNSTRVSSLNQLGRLSYFSESHKIGFVQDTVAALKKRSMAELGAGVIQGASNTTFINLIEWIRSERLATLPHKGSRWDRVLIRALYFAEQLHNFDMAIQNFALDSSAAAELGFGHAKLLLELGHENSEALDKAFGIFYKHSLAISSLLSRSELFAVSSETKEQLCMMYTDLLTLVTSVAIRFYKAVHGMMSTSVSLDMYEVFGDTIESLNSRQAGVAEAIWTHQIQSDGLDTEEVLDVKSLRAWLAPQDRVLATLGRDHTTFMDQQAEFTCLWFQKPLSKFVQSNDAFMLLNGPMGSGKTVLASSIVERLQRPLGRKTFSTLFCSISSAIQSQATPSNVVKSLLYQLLSLRVGNMRIYHALSEAYERCMHASDARSYDNYLWEAFADTLKHPLENANDLLIVVDGLDEITGGQSEAQALLDKLAHVVVEGKRVKLLALSESVSMPAKMHGTQLTITPNDVRDDIHAVAMNYLRHSRHFYTKPGPEQEHLLNRIIQSSQGSFLWVHLSCELLMNEKSPESFAKMVDSLENSRPSVQDLTLRLVMSSDQSTEAKFALSWLLAAERPFTMSEMATLFSIDTQSGSVVDKGIDIHQTLQSMSPILSFHENIVRLKHRAISSSLETLIGQSKLQMPIKDRQMDMLLRALTYARSIIRDNREPMLDDLDQASVDRLFHQHFLLEYVVRYWTFHWKKSGSAPASSGEVKIAREIQKVFPDSTTLPILEKHCWNAQLPTSQALELHILVGRLRSQIFTETHPVVLQTYIICATYYERLSRPTEASQCYYSCTMICRAVLSGFHPLTVECANRFLAITSTMMTQSRTEIMNHREEVLIILITAYERQYGTSSEIVIETRTRLAELYAYIHEDKLAAKQYQIIYEATVKQYGRHSKEARGTSRHLHIVLGKGKDEQNVETYQDSLFFDEEEEEAVDVIDIAHISAMLQKAQEYFSRGEIVSAEQTYVELWQQVSTYCRTVRSVEWHEKNIETAIAYSSFLKSQKREFEASSILSCIWQEYEHHEISYSESIISQLTEVAKVMRTVGQQTVALSIFKRASSYYKNVRKEESHSFTSIQEEITITATEVVKQSSTETTSTVSESVFQDVFKSMITNTSKSVDSKTMNLSKKLTVQYMEQKKWSEAIDIVKTTVSRTWSSFLSTSIHDVRLTSEFLQESIELIECFAECYLQQRQIEKAEDVYVRLFQAVLVSANINITLVDKVKLLLLNFYDKHGYPDKAIGVLQEVLVVYRTKLGLSHQTTIQTLYELGSRCRIHARKHTYWLEYYQQIVSSLNRDSKLCHADAMEAIVIVSNAYWEDGRYPEAVVVFDVLWNTFIQKSKEYKQFSSVEFVKTTYERYFQCLEETRASWESLHAVTSKYRETCSSVFGATSSITAQATLALAQVCQMSEQHTTQAISLYEEVSKTESTSEVKQTLSRLYTKQIMSHSSTKVKSETVERATAIYIEQYSEVRSKYGYTHETTLSQLRELSLLYCKQQKTELAVKELTQAVVEISSKERSSQKMFESALSIAESFKVCEQVQRCTELVAELHRQIIAKDSRNASKFSFNVTTCGRASLAFIAALEYHIRTDLALSFSQIMADTIAEALYYENFRSLMKANEDLSKILLAASPLRWFLISKKRHDLVATLEDEVVGLFVKRDCAKLEVQSKDSPRIFIVAIMEHLGRKKSKSFVRSVILASNDKLHTLIKTNKFVEAYEIAGWAFAFAIQHDGYGGPNAISHGFKLASLLAAPCPDKNLRSKMLQLSNKIVKEIFGICKRLKINFAQVQLKELNQLAVLLGQQEDYETLEWLLTTLWNTRDAQRSWPSQVLLNLGRRLICARYLAGHPIKALRLCEDIAYNMRRVHGACHPITLETNLLLAQLYTSTGQSYQKNKAPELANEYFKKALLVHEEMLRLLVNEGTGADDDDELDTAAALLAEHGVSVHSDHDQSENVDLSDVAKMHFFLLKFAFQRLGSWPKPYAEYERLNADLFRRFQWNDVEGTEKWQAKGFGGGKSESAEGSFAGVQSWEFADDKAVNGNGYLDGEL